MYIRLLLIEDTEASSVGGSQIEVGRPEEQDVASAIRSMNGTTRSTVILQGLEPDLGLMGVGGGAEGQVFCFVIDRHGNEHVLLDPSGPPDSVRVFAGEVSRRGEQEDLDREVVIPAALYFARTGQLDPSANWREL